MCFSIGMLHHTNSEETIPEDDGQGDEYSER